MPQLYDKRSPAHGETIASGAHRIEHWLLGSGTFPAHAYYRIHTSRALENFPIMGTPISIYPDLINALACVKQAAAQANFGLKHLDKKRAKAIVQARDTLW